MAKTKKTKKEQVIETVELETPTSDVQLIQPEKIEDCEWCFQFDEDDAQVFAWMGDDLDNNEDPKVVFTITNYKDSYITFTHKNGKSFKLFARPISDEGKQMRDRQIEITKNLKKDNEHESENKEA